MEACRLARRTSPKRRACGRRRRPATRRLLALLHQEVHALLDQVVAEIAAATLWRHDARLAVESLDGMVVERGLSLGNSRRPGGVVAELGRAGEAGRVAGLADRVIERRAILGHRQHGGGCLRRGLDLERRVVCAGYGDARERLGALDDTRDVRRV